MRIVAKKRPRLLEMAEKAMRAAVNETLKEHKKRGLPIYVWENGKVVSIPANRI